jgi:hypothetical protein
MTTGRAVSPVAIIGVDWTNGERPAGVPAGTTPVVYRELAAVVGEVPISATSAWRRTPPPANVDRHRCVVESLFATRSVLPVPPGVVFRSTEAVVRWLEIHYVTLSDALAYVDGRAEARVHVEAKPGRGVGDGTPDHQRIELDAVAVAIFKALAPRAVGWCAAPPTRQGSGGDASATNASFLVERAQWPQFEAAVAAEGTRDPALGVWVSGPWPPYDFVRMQFGG